MFLCLSTHRSSINKFTISGRALYFAEIIMRNDARAFTMMPVKYKYCVKNGVGDMISFGLSNYINHSDKNFVKSAISVKRFCP